MSIDPRYEDPDYRGPELNGLPPDAAHDLAKQFRIAARNRRLANKLGEERIRREIVFARYTVAFGVAFILGGLAFAMYIVGYFR